MECQRIIDDEGGWALDEGFRGGQSYGGRITDAVYASGTLITREIIKIKMMLIELYHLCRAARINKQTKKYRYITYTIR